MTDKNIVEYSGVELDSLAQQALVYIAEEDSPVKVLDVAEALTIDQEHEQAIVSKQQANARIEKLVEAGFVEKVEEEERDDGLHAAHLYSLTEDGEWYLEDAPAGLNNNIKGMKQFLDHPPEYDIQSVKAHIRYQNKTIRMLKEHAVAWRLDAMSRGESPERLLDDAEKQLNQ